ncbi:MAG: hypothetical protein H7332_11900 [Bdellovibrionales bacterium]|nr:hypothetical protein [Ramlibacter sp.]
MASEVSDGESIGGQIPIQDSSHLEARGTERNWALTLNALRAERAGFSSSGEQRDWGQSPISAGILSLRSSDCPELESDPNYFPGSEPLRAGSIEGQIPIQDSSVFAARDAERNWALTPNALRAERVGFSSSGEKRNPYGHD